MVAVHSPHGTGKITDGTGRCIVVKDCDLGVAVGSLFPDIKVGDVGLDICGKGCSSGKRPCGHARANLVCDTVVYA